MPRPYLVLCNDCQSTWDKWLHPACPSCHPRRAALDEASPATSGGAKATTARGPTGGGRTRSGARERRCCLRERVANSRAVLAVTSFGLGILLYPIVANALLKRPLLEVPAIELREAAQVIQLQDRGATPEDNGTCGPLAVRVSLDEQPIEVLRWDRLPGGHPGTVRYEGTLRNLSPAPVSHVLIEVDARDAGGETVARGWAWANPTALEPGERASFSVTLAERSDAHEVVIGSAWNQGFRQPVVAVPADQSGVGLTPSAFEDVGITLATRDLRS